MKALRLPLLLTTILISHLLAQAQARQSVVTDGYEIYGPSVSAVSDAAAQMDDALTRFRRYFGEAPPKIAIVLIGSPADAAVIDYSSFLMRRVLVLPFPMIAETQTRAAAAGSGVETQVLAHEACHMFFYAYVEAQPGGAAPPPTSLSAADPFADFLPSARRNAPLTGSNYGHPVMPDWLDEAAAMICEPDSMLRVRRENASKGLATTTIPFAELTTMPHPTASQGSAGAAPWQGMRSSNADANPRSLMFYDEISALVQFLTEREGPQILGQIVRATIAGTSLDGVLARTRSLPQDLPGLEREWRRWMIPENNP